MKKSEIINIIKEELSLLTEQKPKKGDFIHDKSFGEYGVVNKVKGNVAYVKFPSTGATSFDPVMVSGLKPSSEKRKGKKVFISEAICADQSHRYEKEESVAPDHDGKAAPYGSGYDKLNEASAKYKAFKSKFTATPPRWATAVAQEKNGKWFYYENEPVVTSSGMKSTGKKEDMDFQGDPKTWNQKPHSFFVSNGRVTEGKLNESMIGIKTTGNFKPADLQKALDKAKIKGYSMNRLSTTLTALKLDKKYFNTAKKLIDALGLSVMMAKEIKETIDVDKVNEATSLWKHFDAKMKLQDEIMDLEMDMKMINKDLSQLHKDMEQEAEPEGGPKATRYGRDIEKKEKEYKKKKSEFKKLMAKLDKMEQY